MIEIILAMMGLDMVNSILPAESWTGCFLRIVVYLWLSRALIGVGFEEFLEAGS
jgi:hypothetical protein